MTHTILIYTVSLAAQHSSLDRVLSAGRRLSGLLFNHEIIVAALYLSSPSGVPVYPGATGQIEGVTIQEQMKQCLENISAILAEAGSSLDKIVSATVVLAEEHDFSGMNEELVRWFPVDRQHDKAQSCQSRFRDSRYRLPSSLRADAPATKFQDAPVGIVLHSFLRAYIAPGPGARVFCRPVI